MNIEGELPQEQMLINAGHICDLPKHNAYTVKKQVMPHTKYRQGAHIRVKATELICG